MTPSNLEPISSMVQICPPKKAETVDWWVLCLVSMVLFTPTFRLPGGVPVRLDDLLVFGMGAVLAANAILKLKIPKPDLLSVYLVALVGMILLSTILAPPQASVGAKEYLDCLRAVKFILIYWVIRRHNPVSARNTFCRAICVSLLGSFVIACLEMLAIRVSSAGALVTFFSAFTERNRDDAQIMMMTRPFATFDTPVHFGYLAVIAMFLAPLLHSRKKRVAIISVGFLALLLSATRTFLLAFPLLLLLHAIMTSRSLIEKLKRLSTAVALSTTAAVVALLVLPIVSPHAAEFTKITIQSIATGDTQTDYSISTRLDNLGLVNYTWENHALLGFGGRSLLPPFVDSELIVTFHRYGIVGLAGLLAFYPIAYLLARRAREHDPEFAHFIVMMLAATFLIGITQAALINSRVGVLAFAVLGITAARNRTAQCRTQQAVPAMP